MIKENKTVTEASELRRKAEEKAASQSATADAFSGKPDTKRLLHELQVHQIELEMQNDELRLAQVELEEQQARYFDLYDLAPVGYVTLSEKVVILEANLTAATLLGMARGELVKQSLYRFILKDDQEIFHSFSKQLLENGEPHACELRMMRHDGSQFWVRIEAIESLNAAGAPVSRVVLRDISEIMQAAEALRVIKEKRHLSILHTSMDGFWLADTQGRLLEVNETYCRMSGYSAQELLAMRITDLEEVETVDVTSARIRVIIAKGEDRFESQHRRKDGSIFDVEVSTQYQPIDEGRLVVFIRDITARKQAVNALRESEEKYRYLFENSRDALMTLEPSMGFTSGNPATVDMFRAKNMEDFITYAPWDLSPERQPDGRDSTEKSREMIETCLREGSHFFEWTHRRIDGGEFPADVLMTRIEKAGKVIILATVRDIAERKRAEEERIALGNQLLHAQKMESVGRLAGGVAHDFNNMLTVILGHAELSLMKIDPAQQIFGYLEQIRNAAKKSADLTRQLLAFARKQVVAPKALDLNATVAGMLNMLQRLIGEDIQINWQPGVNLWQVKVDPSQIDQILANLCVNSRDAIADVGRITIETGNNVFDADDCAHHVDFMPGEYVRLAVSDDGCGMDKEMLSHIYEPFFTTKEMGKGTGLGMATVYGIVKQNNGAINVYSEPGIGTTFTIYLPRYAGNAEQPRTEEAARPALRGRETVLLVEDEPSILQLATIMLEMQGYTMLAASAPGEAIRLARAHPGEIHLLITDVIMPKMNGRDLAKNLLSFYPHLKHLFMSGFTANVIAHHGVLEDGIHFIQKPFSMQGLAAKVREILD
jgi:PAS domain S-box-containing protein